MQTYQADLHIHSCFSPCGAMQMTPQAIVETAIAKGIDLIAVTDHNTAAMAPFVAEAARARGLAFLYGLELQTLENVHLLAYFDDEAVCLEFSDEVYALLPDSTHDPYHLRDQRLVDASGRLIRVEKRFLVNGIGLSLMDAAQRVRDLGGLPVPAHIDRDFFSVRSELGALPEGADFELVEVRDEVIPALCQDSAILKTSDAHDLEQIGRRVTYITFAEPTVEELRKAARCIDGRSLAANVRTD